MRMIKWQNGTVITPDQTKLPLQEVTLEIKTVDQMAEAIKILRVRGAPLLGAAAGFGVALAAYHSKAKTKEKLLAELETAGTIIKRQRPTAVNLFWGVDRVLNKARTVSGNVEEIKAAVIEEAQKIADEDAAQQPCNRQKRLRPHQRRRHHLDSLQRWRIMQLSSTALLWALFVLLGSRAKKSKSSPTKPDRFCRVQGSPLTSLNVTESQLR